MRIALDAMGGDHGSRELVAGAVLAVQKSDVSVSLVGDKSLLERHLSAFRLADEYVGRISIVHASQKIEMHEHPVDAVRKKRDSSIMVSFDLHKSGEVEAVVSAGNSGATLAAGIHKLGRLAGISRPGIASILPTPKKPAVLMDVGATVDCRPLHLYQFAVMASSFARLYSGDNPAVGLLSNGEESSKGNSLVKETYQLLQESNLNFIGNVEGRDVFQGEVDVVVCDGFVGNICLKISEGLAEASMKMLKDEITKSYLAKIGYFFVLPSFRRFKKRVSYDEYGGAPLLGVNGIGIVSHGKSNARAIMNAILGARQMQLRGVNEKIVAAVDAAGEIN